MASSIFSRPDNMAVNVKKACSPMPQFTHILFPYI